MQRDRCDNSGAHSPGIDVTTLELIHPRLLLDTGTKSLHHGEDY